MNELEALFTPELRAQCQSVAREAYLEAINGTLDDSVEFSAHLLKVNPSMTLEGLDERVQEFIDSRLACTMAERVAETVLFEELYKSYLYVVRLVHSNTKVNPEHLTDNQCGETK